MDDDLGYPYDEKETTIELIFSSNAPKRVETARPNTACPWSGLAAYSGFL